MTLDKHDKELALALLDDLTLGEVASKFEIREYVLAYTVLEVDFKIPESIFHKRMRSGALRIFEGSIERKCSKCKEYVAFTYEFWQKNRSTDDGANRYCVFCESIRSKLKYRNNKKKKKQTEAAS